MRLALVSLDQCWHDRGANFERCRVLVQEAAANGCKVIIFPEMTLTGYSLNVSVVAESVRTSESLKWFGELSKSSGAHLIFGSCLLNETTRQPRNVLCHADPLAGVVLTYAKIHPFSYAGEDKFFEAGDTLGFVSLPGIRLGSSICYDLRFSELYAAIASRCEGAICIANWPVKRVAHWRALLVARAIENQMFMVGVNRVGCDGNGLQYEKSSMVVAPDGVVTNPIYSNHELDIYEIDPQETQAYRKKFPTLRDKRNELYDQWR